MVFTFWCSWPCIIRPLEYGPDFLAPLQWLQHNRTDGVSLLILGCKQTKPPLLGVLPHLLAHCLPLSLLEPSSKWGSPGYPGGPVQKKDPGGWEATWEDLRPPSWEAAPLPTLWGCHHGGDPVPQSSLWMTCPSGQCDCNLTRGPVPPSLCSLLGSPGKLIPGQKYLILRAYYLLTPILFKKYLQIFWCHSNSFKCLLCSLDNITSSRYARVNLPLPFWLDICMVSIALSF